MQIHYLWVDSWRNLIEKDINLSAQYRFKFQKKNSKGEHINRLIISRNPDFIPDFFEKPNVSNVTGVIGKNGSGKSTILNYVKAFLPAGLEASLSKDIIVYSLISDISEELYIVHPYRQNVSVEAGDISFRMIPYSDSLMDHLSLRTDSHIDQFDYIYYSYILDQRQEAAEVSGLHNLSTTALLEESRRAIFSSVSNQQTLDPRKSDLEFLIRNELAKAIQLLLSSYKKLLPFNKPPELELYIDPTDEEQLRGGEISDGRFVSTDKETANLVRIQNLFKLLSSRGRSPHTELAIDLASDTFAKAILANFFLMESRYEMGIVSDHIYNLGESESITDFVLRFFRHLAFEKVKIHDDPKAHHYARYLELSESVPEMIMMFRSLIDEGYLLFHVNEELPVNAFTLDMRAGTDEVFEKFFNLYLRIKGFTPFLTFSWRGLSTGEQSFMSFMARFVHLKRHQVGGDQLRKNLLIMIDEGDAGFHPAWQKEFFKTSLDFLSDLFKDHIIQMIYTANAPFLTSDLPKSHILFLEKKSIDETKFHTKDNNRLETFGANIHQLFMDSFYMDGVLIGDFAKYKIDKIISFLNDRREDRPNEHYLRTIEQIGEPLIRKKLLLMWEEKFGVLNELRTLQARVKELQAIEKAKRRSTNNKRGNK